MRTVRDLLIGLSWIAGTATVAGVGGNLYTAIDERFMAGGNYPPRLADLAWRRLGIRLELLNRGKGETYVCAPDGGAITAATSWHSTGGLRAPALAAAQAAGCDRMEILIGGQDGIATKGAVEYTAAMEDLLDELLAASWLKKVIYHTGACAVGSLGTYESDIYPSWDAICTAYAAAYPGRFFRGVDLYAKMLTKGVTGSSGPLLFDNAHCTVPEGLAWMARTVLAHNVSIGFYG